MNRHETGGARVAFRYTRFAAWHIGVGKRHK